jgi:hypothetical protein
MENFKAESNEVGNLYKNFSKGPFAPEETESLKDYTSLSSIKEILTESFIDPSTEVKINSIIEDWLSCPQEARPISQMRSVLDDARKIPAGEERTRVMNTIVRTLGQPETLATYLDMLRDSANRNGTLEQELCRSKLQNVRMHSIYGWCGNTLLSESHSDVVEGTYESNPELGKKLGNSPAAWNLTMHIWQPNLGAKGFPIRSGLPEGTILEPPHSHPFNFVSKIVKGNIRQNIYKQNYATEPEIRNEGSEPGNGYYHKEILEHVDGVWPPHDFDESVALKTIEHRVQINEGDSYYMPCDWIHDVEVDGNQAATKPTISLFLSSEYLVMPHVYMTKQMLDHHTQNPNIKKTGSPIEEDAWKCKLELLSAYLRGESETLNLNDVVKHEGTYAFFNINK